MRRKKIATKPALVQAQAVVPQASKHIICVDANVLIQDPEAISQLLKGGNLVVIPWQVIFELDRQKKSDVGWESQKAIVKIHQLTMSGANIRIERRMNFSKLDLEKDMPDNKIVACVSYVIKSRSNANSPYHGYDKVKLVTNDYNMQIIALEVLRSLDFSVEFYKRDLAKLKDESFKLKSRNVPSEEIKKDDKGEEYVALAKNDKTPYNSPIVIYSDIKGDWRAHKVAYRKGDRLLLLDPNISLSGIRPKNNGGPNWQQITALHLLSDPDINAVFLQGGAGTGKTLLALAAALHQKGQKRFNQIIVVRPTVHLSDDDNLGYLPGDIDNKMSPWLLSIKQNLSVINPPKKNKSTEDEEAGSMSIFSKNNIEIQPLGYIRGASFAKCFIMVEEAQNLSRHIIRTILTRPAEGTKIVFTGDLSQIDNRRLNKESSGLAYAISKMSNHPMIGVVIFEQTLRSPLASLAEKIL